MLGIQKFLDPGKLLCGMYFVPTLIEWLAGRLRVVLVIVLSRAVRNRDDYLFLSSSTSWFQERATESTMYGTFIHEHLAHPRSSLFQLEVRQCSLSAGDRPRSFAFSLASTCVGLLFHIARWPFSSSTHTNKECQEILRGCQILFLFSKMVFFDRRDVENQLFKSGQLTSPPLVKSQMTVPGSGHSKTMSIRRDRQSLDSVFTEPASRNSVRSENSVSSFPEGCSVTRPVTIRSLSEADGHVYSNNLIQLNHYR